MIAPVLPVLLAAAAAAIIAGLPAPSRLRSLGPSAGPSRGLNPRIPYAAGGLALVFVLGPVGAVVAGVVAVVGHRAWRRRCADRVRERERASAAEALVVLGAELRAGRSAADALQAAGSVAVGPLAVALSAASTGQRFGADAAGALARSADGTATPETVRGLAACWQVCSATGSSLAAAVERLADALRAEREQRLAVEAELAGPRATAGLLAVLPLLGIALAAGLGARPLHVLLHTSIGLGCLVGGIGLDLLGLWWTGRLVASAGGTR